MSFERSGHVVSCLELPHSLNLIQQSLKSIVFDLNKTKTNRQLEWASR